VLQCAHTPMCRHWAVLLALPSSVSVFEGPQRYVNLAYSVRSVQSLVCYKSCTDVWDFLESREVVVNEIQTQMRVLAEVWKSPSPVLLRYSYSVTSWLHGSEHCVRLHKGLEQRALQRWMKSRTHEILSRFKRVRIILSFWHRELQYAVQPVYETSAWFRLQFFQL
jgi:hypothetical protein